MKPMADEPWCTPTREVENAKLVKLVHASNRRTEASVVEAMQELKDDDLEEIIEALANPLDPVSLPLARGSQPIIVEADRETALIEVPSAAPVYPMAPDHLRPVRVVLGISLVAAIATAVVLALLL
jgi:hypothetical protein